MDNGHFDILKHFHESNEEVKFNQVSIDLVRRIEHSKVTHGFREAYESLKCLAANEHHKTELVVSIDKEPYLVVATSYGKGWFVSLESA